MAGTLIAWEMGGGFGHILRYKSLISQLASEGQPIYFAARDLTSAQHALKGHAVTLIQSPGLIRNSGPVLKKVASYAHILSNTGFNDATVLAARLRAWQFIYDSVRPDRVIFDHCPTGMTAAKAYDFVKIHCGSGFTLPPAIRPFPVLQQRQTGTDTLLQFEQGLLDNINQALDMTTGNHRVQQLQDILSADHELLLSLEELDCYAPREAARYIGPVVPAAHGKAVNWTVGKQPKLFGYLKQSEHLHTLLETIRRKPVRAVIYAPDMTAAERQALGDSRLRLTDTPASLPASIRQCRFVINNGNNATVTQALLAGIPLLLLPRTLEEYLTSCRVEALGAGIVIGKQTGADTLADGIEQLLQDGRFRVNATRFAKRYREHAPDRAAQCLLDTVRQSL